MNKIIGFLIIIIITLGGFMYLKEQKQPLAHMNTINTGDGLISGSGIPLDTSLIKDVSQDMNRNPQASNKDIEVANNTAKEDVVVNTESDIDDSENISELNADNEYSEFDETVEPDNDNSDDTDDEGEALEDEEAEPDVPEIEAAPDADSPYTKSLYMWTAPFSTHSSSTIVDFINNQYIDTAIISMNQAHTARITKVAVINNLSASGKKIEVMLSKNSTINAPDDEILAYVESVFSGSFNFSSIDRIHLDIEPHVMDDWHDNKTAYLDKYMNMLGIIKDYAESKGVGISVSIPLHYPIDYTKQIFDTVDKVYFMAYENISISHITRKTSEYLPTYRSKINLALRTNDFDNRIQLEDLANTLLSDMNLGDYAIHDFQSLKEFVDGE